MKNFTLKFIGIFALVFAMSFNANSQDLPLAPLFFSEYGEGSGNNKYLEIYNPTDEFVFLYDYGLAKVTNEPEFLGLPEVLFSFIEISYGADGYIEPGGTFVIAHPNCDFFILDKANVTFPYLSNGDDGMALIYYDDFTPDLNNSYQIIDAIGDFYGDPGSGWDVAGIPNATKDHTLVRRDHVTSGNLGDWTSSAGTSTDDSEWIVLDQDTWAHLGSHGCYSAEQYYDCNDVCLNDSDQDGVCDEIEVVGCTDSEAFNYNDEATDDNGSCVAVVNGCMDSSMSNYNSEANTEDGSCISWVDVVSNLQADVDAAYAAGVASVEIPECEEVATQNIPLDLPEGWSMFGYTCLESLDVVEAFSGVSDNIEIIKDEWGLAYLPSYGFSAFDNLEFGEGYQIKMIEEVTDFQFCTTIAGGASQEELDAAIAEVHAIYDGWCESDVDNDGVCDIDEVSGCVESNACNYNVNATDDDGSCAFAFPFYDCSGLCLNDDNDNNICDELEVFGCMNETSCNYNELANMDDGSCEGLLGCTMEFFSEFNPDATCDDESCETVYACMDEASPNYQPGVELDAMMYGVFPIHDDSMCGQEGCMIEQGCNYDPSNEFGSIDLCEFPEEGFDCNGNIFNINELQIGDYYAGGIVYILNDDGTGWVVNPVQSIVWMTGGEYYEKINQANSNINYETNGDYGDWQLAGYNDYVTLSELFGPLSSEYPQFCNPGDYSWGFNDDNPNIMSDSQANFIFCDGSVQDVVWGWWFWPNVNYRLVRAF